MATKKYVDLDGLSRFKTKADLTYVAQEAGKGLSTNDYTTAEKNKLAGIAEGAQVNTITGVKGNSETTYRTGNVNITKTNIGLSNVENKSSATIRGELTSSDVTTALGYTPPTSDTNTTYTFAEGSTNGKFSVTPSGGTAQSVAVHGINNAAYKDVDSTIAAASTSTKLPTSQAVASFVEGKGYTTNTGTITGVSVNGTSVATSGVANITSIPGSILTGAIKDGVTATTQSAGDNSTKVATTAYVDTAIDNLPEPMVFKGSLGTSGTITALPVDGTANIGDTYKVITAGTYASKTAKVGDTFICLTKTSSANTWELIPSGDEPSGTVTSITIKATSPIIVSSSSAITSSGTRTLSHATSGVTAGTYRSVTVNASGHVTAGTNPTTLSGYGITDAKIASGVITLGSNTITPLTSSSSLDASKLTGTVPSDCYTDTTYESKTATNGGTDVSLVTTGEKYTWNNKSDSDTKNTAGSTDSSSKLFLIGATSQGANPQTYSQDTVYAGTDGHLYSNSKQAVNLSDTQSLTNKTYNGLTLTKNSTGFSIAGGTTSRTLTVSTSYTLKGACAKAVDTSISAGSTSTNLPTTKAVVDFVATVAGISTGSTSLTCSIPTGL